MAVVKIGRKAPPREQGGLESLPLLCSVCGPIGSSSLPATARQVARDHEEWHRRQGK